MTATHNLAEVLAAHRRCFYPDGGPAFCACNEWSHPGRTDGIEYPDLTSGLGHHEHQAQAWRDACTITTTEQLDALPFLTIIREVIRDSPSGNNYGAVYERHTSGWQCIAGTYKPRDPDGTWNADNGPPTLPALLIWSPGWAP